MIRTPRGILVLLAFAAAALAAACNTATHPKPVFAYDHTASFAGLKTYAWFKDPAWKMPHGDSIIDGEFLDRHIRSSVDAKLQARGFQKVADPATASMLVSYNTGDTGVGEHDEFGNYEWWTGYVVATNWEKSRTVTIDIRNPSKKLIWRGQVARLEGQNPDAVGRELDREISTLLDKFPPS